MIDKSSVVDLLQGYLQALSAKDADGIDALLDEQALVEIPFLKPNRLVGTAELAKGHNAMFQALDAIRFEASSIESNAAHAIAEGKLEFSRDGGETLSLEAGIVAEISGTSLRRLSLYCDARNIRPWSDKTIL